MPDTKLNIKIKQQVEKTPLQELQAEMRKVGAEQQKLYINGQQNSKTFQDNAQKINTLAQAMKALKSLSKGTSGLSGFQILEAFENISTIGIALNLATAKAITFGKALFAAAQEGANFGVLLDSFQKIGGTDLDLKFLDIAAAGNLSERQLISYAQQMKVLGIGIKDTTTLLDAIEKQSDLTSISFEAGNEAVKKFIATGSGRGLVGFMNINVLKDEVTKLNEEFVRTGGALTEVQEEMNRAQAIINIYGDASGDLSKKVKDNADKVATVSTRIENFKDRLSLAVSEGLIPFIDNMEDVDFGKVTTEAAQAIISIAGFVRTLSKVGGAIQDSIVWLVRVTTNVRLVTDAYQKAEDAVRQFLNLQKEAQEGTKQLVFETEDVIQLDKFGNPIAPKPVIAENTDFTGGRNLGEGTDKSTGTGKTKKEKEEELLYLAQLKKDLVDLQAIMSRQSNTENIIGGFLGKEKDLQSLIFFTENLEKFFNISSQIETLGLKGRSPIEPITGKTGLSFEDQIALAEHIRKQQEEALQKQETSFKNLVSDSQTVVSILGSAGLDKGLSDIQEMISFAESLFNLLASIGIGGGGGVFGFISSIFGGGGGSSVASPGSVFTPSAQVGGRSLNINVTGELRGKGTNLLGVVRRTENIETALLS